MPVQIQNLQATREREQNSATKKRKKNKSAVKIHQQCTVSPLPFFLLKELSTGPHLT